MPIGKKKYIPVWDVSTNNPRVQYVSPQELHNYEGKSQFLINPDLKHVVGLPPHLWKITEGKVEPMTEKEAQEREDHQFFHGVIYPPASRSPSFTPPNGKKIIYTSLALTALTALLFLLNLYITLKSLR